MRASTENRYDREARLCLRDGGEGGEFRSETLAQGRVLRRADVPAERLLDAVRGHDDRILDPSRRGILKADRRALVTAVELPGGTVCVKEFRRPGRRQRAGDALRGSHARRAWLGAHACRARGIRTPRALGILEGRGRCWFVSELVAAATLPEWVADHLPAGDEAARRRWHGLLDATADFVARLHAHRLRHHDLSAKNLLVREGDGGFELLLLDLSDVSLGRRPSRRLKIRNLSQLGAIPEPTSCDDALRFFRRYASEHPDVERGDATQRIWSALRERQQRWLDEQGGREWLAERRGAR